MFIWDMYQLSDRFDAPAARFHFKHQYSVFSNCSSTVTVSPSGPPGLFKGVTTAMSGVIDRFPLLLPVRNPVAGYGASAVTRTPDRGHVAEVKNQFHRGGGVSIRVSNKDHPKSKIQILCASPSRLASLCPSSTATCCMGAT